DQRTADGAALIRTTGREALADLREVLGILRAPPTTGPSTPLPAAGHVHPLPATFPDPVSAPARPLPAGPLVPGPDPRAGEARLNPQPVLADLDRLLDQSRTAGV